MAKSTPTIKTKAEKESQEGPSSNDAFASLLNQHSGDLYNDVVPLHRIISTGSLIMDSYIKIRSGSIVRLLGRGSELGKTSESLVLATNYMSVMPKSKTLYVKAEARLSEEMRERSGLIFFEKTEDIGKWVDGTVFVLDANAFEAVAGIVENQIKQMHERGEHLCVIIDSLDGLILKKDLEIKGIDGNQMVAGVPKLTKLLFRRLALPIVHYDTLMIITSQYSTDIKIDPYAPAAPRQGAASGGSAVMHQADYVIQYSQRFKTDDILEKPDEKPDYIKNKTIGVWAKLEILKSASDTTGIKLPIPIKKGRKGCAIWVEKEVVDMAISEFDIYKKSGSWFTLNEQHPIINEAKEAGITLKDKVQGINALYEYIEADKPVFEWLYAKFRKLVVSE